MSRRKDFSHVGMLWRKRTSTGLGMVEKGEMHVIYVRFREDANSLSSAEYAMFSAFRGS